MPNLSDQIHYLGGGIGWSGATTCASGMFRCPDPLVSEFDVTDARLLFRVLLFGSQVRVLTDMLTCWRLTSLF